MTAYQFIETPFGNFAALLRTVEDSERDRGINYDMYLQPLGELTYLPTKINFEGTTVLDLDEIEAEGARQQPENVGSIWKPRPQYVINNKTYGNDLNVMFGNFRPC